MHDARAEAMAQAALVYWGKAAGPPRLIKNRENVVFEARLEGGAHVALRLHRPGYQSRAAVEAELRWCAALAEAGFPAPAPVAARNGRLTAMVDRSVVSCVVWLDGAPIGAGDAPLGPDAGAVRAEAEALGALVARLHFAASPREALRDADALVIVTEWKEFRSPDFDAIKSELKQPLIFDGRNLYDPKFVRGMGIDYFAIGR